MARLYRKPLAVKRAANLSGLSFWSPVFPALNKPTNTYTVLGNSV